MKTRTKILWVWAIVVAIAAAAGVALAQNEPLCRDWLNSAWNAPHCERDVPASQRADCVACVHNYHGGLHHWHANLPEGERCHRTDAAPR